MSDSRHNARILALQKLFEISFPDITPKVNSDFFSYDSLLEIDELTDFDKKLVEKLVKGVIKYYSQIDKVIVELAPAWPIEKINKLDLQILRLAVLEAFILKITPEKVAINEAIELTKDFSNEQSRRFVNGVLGNLLINKEKYFQNETN